MFYLAAMIFLLVAWNLILTFRIRDLEQFFRKVMPALAKCTTAINEWTELNDSRSVALIAAVQECRDLIVSRPSAQRSSSGPSA